MAISIPEPSHNLQNLQQWLFLIVTLASLLILWRTRGKKG